MSMFLRAAVFIAGLSATAVLAETIPALPGPAPAEAPSSSTAPVLPVQVPPAFRQAPGEASGSLSKPQDSTMPVSPDSPQVRQEKEAPVSGDGDISGLRRTQEHSEVETLFQGYDEAVPGQRPPESKIPPLRQFGYSFFHNPDRFNLTDVPVGPDYVVGPGDEIVISVWGSFEGNYTLQVNRSGEIILPKVGALRVWGATFQQLPDMITKSLSRVLRDFHVNVTMGKLHLIKVYVVGEVKSPGVHSISSLSTVLSALSAAGGPLNTGSLRKVEVRRGTALVDTLDFYEFFLKGDRKGDLRLQSGDTIFVPLIGNTAAVAGNVRRPGIYELVEEKTLADVVALAGGILPDGFLQRIQVARLDPHNRRFVIDFDIDPRSTGKDVVSSLAEIPVRNVDLVRVSSIDGLIRQFVSLEGHTLRKGAYELKPGMKLTDVMTRDNLLPEYCTDFVEIVRLVPPDLHPEKIYVSPVLAFSGNPAHNITLREFDRIRVFSRWDMEQLPTVRIGGEVHRPGTYRLLEKMRVRDLVLEAGNIKETAYLKDAEIARISRRDSGVRSYPVIINLHEALAGNPDHDILLNAGDELTVRKIPNWAEETEKYVTIAGEVRFPGTYPVFKGERLSEVIQRAGGFTESAFLLGAKLIRRSVQEDQQKRLETMLRQAETDIAKKQGELASLSTSKEELESVKASLEVLQRGLEKVKAAKAEGRVIIRLLPLEEFRNSPHNIEAMGGDVLTIPRTMATVNVLGDVYNPNTVLHVPGKDVSHYLDMAGGPTRSADPDDMYIIRVDGTIDSSHSHGSIFNRFTSVDMDPGDTLIVPQRIERTAWMREIKDITTILSQAAMVAGVLVAAGI